jgi:regulatory protein
LPVLTGLAPDPRQPGYRLVEVDRGRFASLPAEALQLLPLSVGREIPERVLDRLRELADTEAAYRAAVRIQKLRGHARLDLKRRLLRKQHPPAAADGALDRLTAQGLLDDRAFALHYAATRALRGRGAPRLIKDLLAQGVERRVAEDAVQRALESEGLDEGQALRAVAERRAGQLAGLPSEARRRRLVAFLARRGFSGTAVRELVKELCG